MKIDDQMVELFERADEGLRGGGSSIRSVPESRCWIRRGSMPSWRRSVEKAHGEFNALGAQELFQQIMAISRKRQYQLLTEYGPKEKEDFQMVEQLPRNRCNSCFPGSQRAPTAMVAMRAYFQEGHQELSCEAVPGCHGRGSSRKSRLRSPSY